MSIRVTRRAALLGATLAVPTIRTAQAQQTFEWVAGSVGGGWYTMAAGLSSLIAEDNPALRIRVVPGGGLANSTRVNNNQSAMGWGIDTFTAAAAKGEDPYSAKHENLRSLGTGYSPTEHNLVRRADAGPEDMRGILTQRGLRIACPQRSSTDEMTLQRILRFLGTSPDAIRAAGGRYLNGSYTDIASAYADGQVDYLYAALATPQGRCAARQCRRPDLRRTRGDAGRRRQPFRQPDRRRARSACGRTRTSSSSITTPDPIPTPDPAAGSTRRRPVREPRTGRSRLHNRGRIRPARLLVKQSLLSLPDLPAPTGSLSQQQ